MSLHIYLVEEELQDGGDESYPTSYKTVFKCKLSDNLKEIAKRCDVYECLWNRRSLSVRKVNNRVLTCGWSDLEALELVPR